MKLIFHWYDFYFGFFWDENKKWLYIFPIPMFGLLIKCNRIEKIRKGDLVKYIGKIKALQNREMRVHRIQKETGWVITSEGMGFKLSELKRLR